MPSCVLAEGQVEAGVGSECTLFSMLLGGGSNSRLSLPPSSTFTPLHAPITNLPVNDTRFATHGTCQVPLDASNSLAHVVHRFELQRQLAGPLNCELSKYAIAREADFRERQRVWKARCDFQEEASTASTVLGMRWACAARRKCAVGSH